MHNNPSITRINIYEVAKRTETELPVISVQELSSSVVCNLQIFRFETIKSITLQTMLQRPVPVLQGGAEGPKKNGKIKHILGEKKIEPKYAGSIG